MMTGLRNAGKTWLGKIVVGVLFFFLIVSFAIWGIGDIFRGGSRNTIATVGDGEITVQAYRDAFTQEMQNQSRRLRRNVTNEEAMREGLDRQVLARMISEAALDQRARELGLGMSDKAMAQAIIDDPSFKGPNGAFSRELFNEALRSSGFTEQTFVREQRRLYLRQQIAETVSGGVVVPQALREAFHRLRSETRTIAYVELDPARIGPVAAPDEAALKAAFEQRKAALRAPEYRAFNLLVLRPDDIAKPDEVAEADVRAEYERVKTQRFGTPERRVIERLPFPDPAAAEAAARRLSEGLSFAALAEEMKVTGADLTLGRFSRAEMFDASLGDAAFALAEGAVSGVVTGRFGPVILRVASIEPENVRPFGEVEIALRNQLARERARRSVQALHDRIEDQRASAKTLAQIAPEFGLTVRAVDGIDAQGLDRAGANVDLPDRATLLPAVFRSDVGADAEALTTREGGYLWFEVTRVDGSRERSFEEARTQLEAFWIEDDTSRRLSALAGDWVRKLDAGQDFSALASEAGLEVRTAANVTRTATPDGLSSSAMSLIFSAKTGSAGAVPSNGRAGRIVYRVIDAAVPPYLSTTREAEQLDTQLRAAMADDLLVAYVSRLEADAAARINEPAFRAATRGSTDF